MLDWIQTLKYEQDRVKEDQVHQQKWNKIIICYDNVYMYFYEKVLFWSDYAGTGRDSEQDIAGVAVQ